MKLVLEGVGIEQKIARILGFVTSLLDQELSSGFWVSFNFFASILREDLASIKILFLWIRKL